MNEHLDDLQMAALLAGETDAHVQRHLASCAVCAAERQRLTRAIGGWRGELQLGSERPAAFWERQRGAIAAQRQARSHGSVRRAIAGVFGATGSERPRRMRWAIAATAAGLVAILLGLALRSGRPTARDSGATWIPNPPATSAIDSTAAEAPALGLGPTTADDALLVAVEGAVTRRAPAALAPAEALVRELDRSRAEGGES